MFGIAGGRFGRDPSAVNAAIETLLLGVSGWAGGVVPERALVLGAEPHPAFSAWEGLVGWQPWRGAAAAWEAAGLRAVERPSGTHPWVMVLPGKSREEILSSFAWAADHVEPGGHVVVAMANTAGAGRYEKEFARGCGSVDSVQKHKCRAFHVVADGSWDREVIDEWRACGGRRRIEGTGYWVEAGVFSAGRIDPGSALLAANLPGGWRGRVADLGAGWGYLSDAVMRRHPGVERIDLYEADARALSCARDNLAGHGARCGFHWHDVTEGVPGGYDAVVMNPPFHSGQVADIGLGVMFIGAAAQALRVGGQLCLVANRQLPYEGVLEAHRFAWRVAGEDGTYKLLFAQKR